MSKNGDESSDSDRPVSEDSSEDGYSVNDGIEYRHYINPIMYLVPEEQRSYVRKLCKDTGKVDYN